MIRRTARKNPGEAAAYMCELRGRGEKREKNVRCHGRVGMLSPLGRGSDGKWAYFLGGKWLVQRGQRPCVRNVDAAAW